MNQRSGRHNRSSVLLIGMCSILLGTASTWGQSFLDAACYVFEGEENCRSVTIIDPDNCIIKVRPHPIAQVDPSLAGCLIDDLQTKKFFLNNTRPRVVANSDLAPAAGEKAARSTIQMSGPDVVQILTGYDLNGAPIWEPQDAYTIEHQGDPDTTRAALEHLSANFCNRKTPATGPMSLAKNLGPEDNKSPPIMDVKEAFTLAAQGEILLIDIRHESEWRNTGVGVNATPITMHQGMKGFVKQLGLAADESGGKPIALICAGGVRSAFLQRALKGYGFTQIIDVHEGMLGSLGWIKSGLPTKPYKP